MFTIPSISMESVSFQLNHQFFDQLVKVLSGFDFTGDNKKVGESIKKVIKDQTEISTEVVFDRAFVANIAIPTIDVNHFLLKTKETYNNNTVARYALARNQDNPIGWVDYKTGKVHGIFRDIKHPITLGTAFFSLATPEEMAASILHEVGHAVSHFANLGVNVICGLGLMTLVQDLMFDKSESKDHRVAIVKQFTKESGINISRVSKLVECDNAVDAIIELNRDYNATYRSETGNDITDSRLWETMADQYVVRMGGGAHLATVISKINKLFPSKQVPNYGVDIFIGFYGLLFSIVFSSVIPITLGITWIAMRNSNGDIIRRNSVYHGPAERIRKIRQEMILALRLGKFSDKETLLKQIDDLEKIIKDSYDDIALTKESLFWFMTSKDRKIYINNTDLDAIGRNDLFVKGHQLTV